MRYRNSPSAPSFACGENRHSNISCSKKYPCNGSRIVRLAFIALLAAGITTTYARATTYNVTCNGSDVTDQINADVAQMQAGDNVLLSAGTCVVHEPITGFSTNGTAAAPITLQGARNHATTLQATSVNAPYFPFDVIQVDNLVTVNGDNTVTVTPANNVTIAGLTIDGGVTLGTSGTQPGCYQAGIPGGGDSGAGVGDSGSGVEVVTGSNEIVNNLIIQNVITGVTLMGTNTSYGSSAATVKFVTVNGAQANGIYVIGRGGCEISPLLPTPSAADGNQLLHNTVENLSQYIPAGDGQLPGGSHGWDGLDTELASNMLIQYNTVDGDDIIVNCRTSKYYCSGNQILNNNINNTLNVGIDLAGQQEDFTIENNTIATTNWGGITLNGPFVTLNNPQNLVEDNTITGSGQGDPPSYPGLNCPGSSCEPGISYNNSQPCDGINIQNTTLYGTGQFPQNLTVSGNSVGTVYVSPIPPYGAVCLWGSSSTNADYSSVSITSNYFTNRPNGTCTDSSCPDIQLTYVSNPPTQSGNQDTN